MRHHVTGGTLVRSEDYIVSNFIHVSDTSHDMRQKLIKDVLTCVENTFFKDGYIQAIATMLNFRLFPLMKDYDVLCEPYEKKRLEEFLKYHTAWHLNEPVQLFFAESNPAMVVH